MNLHDDTGSIKIAGYASIFGVTYELGGHLERIEPGAFDLVRFDVFAAFDHDDRPGRRLGWTRDQTLRIWQDRTGLAFELAMPSSHSTLGLVRGIRSGTLRACSFRCGDDAGVQAEIVLERGQPIRRITRLAVDEISVCPAGANPAACCWVVDDPIEQMPDHVRRLRAAWSAGRLQAQIAARAARSKASAKLKADRARAAHRVPTSVRAILAQGRPRGWVEAANALARERR